VACQRFSSKPEIALDVRIVVQYGEVFWGALGTDHYQCVSLLTQNVIQAARLMQYVPQHSSNKKKSRLVGPGEVWVFDSVHSKLKGDYAKLPIKTCTVSLPGFDGVTQVAHRIA
jgi:class 3 adenylate cyclase